MPRTAQTEAAVSEGNWVVGEKEHLIQALIHYRLLTFHLEQGSPGYRISGWQEQFLNAIGDLATKADEREKRAAQS